MARNLSLSMQQPGPLRRAQDCLPAQGAVLKENPLLVCGAASFFIYSFALTVALPLPSIPFWAYLPVFAFVVTCLLGNNTTFVVGWMMAGILAGIGDQDLTLAAGELASREVVHSFGSFKLGFVNLGLANSALVLCSVFVAKNYLRQSAVGLGVFVLPLILIVFSIVQYFLYPGYLQITTFNRVVIIGLFVALTLGHLAFSREELPKITHLSLLLLAVLPLFSLLRFFDASGGRGTFILAMAGIPLAVYLFKTRQTLCLWLALPVLLIVLDALIFRTYWSKLMVITSVVAIVLLPIIQRNRILFLVFPAFSILLPLSSLVLEPTEELAGVVDKMTEQREDARGIGDLREFSLEEVKDLVLYKYKEERAGLWRSSLSHNFSRLSLETFIPDPSVHFILYSGPSAGLWTNGPHHGFLWLLRVYGVIAGGLIFIFLNWLLYKNIMVPWKGGAMRWVLQPFLLCFAIIGFHVGDYPLNSSGSFLVFLLLGLAIAHNRIRETGRVRPRLAAKHA